MLLPCARETTGHNGRQTGDNTEVEMLNEIRLNRCGAGCKYAGAMTATSKCFFAFGSWSSRPSIGKSFERVEAG
jgi:hypothetical protein